MMDAASHRAVEIASILAQELNTATEPVQAAVAVLEAIAELVPWDCAYVAGYSTRENMVHGIYFTDTMDTAPTSIPVPNPLPPSEFATRALIEGPQLILRPAPALPPPGQTWAFGAPRGSACLMYVPMRKGQENVGIISIQSYTPNQYTAHDLSLLVVFANVCASALMRIWAEQELAELPPEPPADNA